MSKIWKIIDIIKWAESYFHEKEVDSPRLTIELLLCELLNLSRVELYLKFDKPLLEKELSSLRNLVKRRANGEPLQYIIGHTQFTDMKIFVDKNVLIPRPETEYFCTEIFEIEKEKNPKNILDIGTGSGIIALYFAKNFPNSKVYGIDISEEALELAEKNQRQNKISNVEFHRLDILQKMPKTKFDIIISNPPYIPKDETYKLQREVVENEPIIALTDGSDGLTFYKRFASIFNEILQNDGRFYLEIDTNNSNEIYKLFSLFSHSKLIKDQYNLDRFIYGKK